MTFKENLESAKNGNKRSYGMLCNSFADRLFAVAFLVLDGEDEAERTVKNAFDDGFGSIARINDENHLCAWLSRELTKHIVARLKEYRAENRTVSGGDIPEKAVLCRLNDLDRLVFAFNLAFGYKTKEISVITGLKEETVQRKLSEAEKKAGGEVSAVTAYINGLKAPEALITKEPQVHDLTVEIDSTDDDRLISEMERVLAIAESEEMASVESASPKLIKFQPLEKQDIAEKEEEPITPQPEAVEEKTAEPTEEKAETAVEEPHTEPVSEEPKPEPPAEEEVEPQKREIDARTFINVITAQKIKGSEFLKLMGNTRISNSAYREIEQNPNLTKDRLVQLLEQSPLTSEDYYKILTAIKQRSELMLKKEEARRRNEQAGLFTINKEPKPAEPTHVSESTLSFSSEKVKEEPPKPLFTAQIKDEPKESHEIQIDDKPYSPRTESGLSYDTEEKSEPQTGRREKYKGREFFIDDDVYYNGVNNGKLAFCAVCAALLLAGSFAVRYFTTGSLLPTENGGAVFEEKEKLPEEYLSNADIYDAISKLETAQTNNSLGYYKTDGKPYSPVLTKDFVQTDEHFYILSDGKILKYSFDSENPFIHEELAIDESREFLGFAAVEDKIYLFYKDEYSETVPYIYSSEDENGQILTEEKSLEISRKAVAAECYDSDFAPLFTYKQDGDFVNVKISADSITLATSLNTAENAVKEAERTFLPAYALDGEESVIGYGDITVPDGISCNGFTVIGTVSGGEVRASAVLGGTDGYVSFNGDECLVLIPDGNKTVACGFRFIGSRLDPLFTEIYSGECYGTECINGDRTVITAYDAVNGYTFVQKKNGEEYTAISGIGTGERLSGVSYTEKHAYIVTENAAGEDILYCVDISGAELTAAEAAGSAVYTEKLMGYGEELIGLTAEAGENGERKGLRLSVYGYDGELTEKRSVLITMDENTDPANMRYLFADAEESNLRIAADSESGCIAVSTVYFDGISEIERIVCFKDDGTTITETGDLLLFDIQSDYRYLSIRNDILYLVTDSSVIALDPENAAPLNYFRGDEGETEAEDESEQAAE